MRRKVIKIDKCVSILGCGWLGLPVAQRLTATHSTWKIKGSTTSESKIAQFLSAGVVPYHFDLTPDFSADAETLASFFDTDLLIISLPPRAATNGPDLYPRQIKAIMEEASKSRVKDIIFISSTGVYPDLSRVMVEADVTLPEQSALPAMVMAENMIESLRPEKNVSILRLGGLLGYQRNPGKYVRGKKDIETGSIPVNYIHRDDARNIILKITEEGLVNDTFNIVVSGHPTRRQVYEESCLIFGWECPTFAEPENPLPFKVISNQKFVETYAYEFQYPDPLTFHYSENEA